MRTPRFATASLCGPESRGRPACETAPLALLDQQKTALCSSILEIVSENAVWRAQDRHTRCRASVQCKKTHPELSGVTLQETTESCGAKNTPQRLREKGARRLQTAQSINQILLADPIFLRASRQSGRFVYDPGGVAHRTSGEELARLGEVQEIVRPIFQHTLEREFDLLLRRVVDMHRMIEAPFAQAGRIQSLSPIGRRQN